MKKHKILTIVGARPQFIKSSIVSRHLLKKKHLNEILIHTGQHYDEDMSHIFFEQLNITKPKYLLKTGKRKHNQIFLNFLFELHFDQGVLLKKSRKIC